jgi:hypothetical protein
VEVVVAYFKALSQPLHGELSKTTNTSINIFGQDLVFTAVKIQSWSSGFWRRVWANSLSDTKCASHS